MSAIRSIYLGTTPPCELTSQVARDMESLAFDLWHRTKEAIALVTWAGGKCYCVHCTGEWFDGTGGHGIFAWELLK